MAKSRSERARRRSGRCVHCGKELPVRKGRPASVCPTCGASQEFEEDPLARRSRVPSHEFHGANLVGVIVGGVIGLLLGGPFAALVYRQSEPLILLLFVVLYALGFAFLGCAFGFMTVGFWRRLGE